MLTNRFVLRITFRDCIIKYLEPFQVVLRYCAHCRSQKQKANCSANCWRKIRLSFSRSFFCVFVQQFFSVDNKAATSTEKSEFDTKTVGSMFADFYRNLRYQLGMSKKNYKLKLITEEFSGWTFKFRPSQHEPCPIISWQCCSIEQSRKSFIRFPTHQRDTDWR